MAFFTERPIPDRPYFKVGEVASLLGVAPSAVRYWQKEFPNHIKAELSYSGQNVFLRNDVVVMAVILNLVRFEGLSIKDARGRLTEVIKEHGGKIEDIKICQQFELPLCADVVPAAEHITDTMAAEEAQAAVAEPVDNALVESLQAELAAEIGINESIQAELAAQLAINESLAMENVSLKKDIFRIEATRRTFESKVKATLIEIRREIDRQN
jgi:DNA-binding transcriptional MerR regulator